MRRDGTYRTIDKCETCRESKTLHTLYRIPKHSSTGRNFKIVCGPCREKWLARESTIGGLLLSEEEKKQS